MFSFLLVFLLLEVIKPHYLTKSFKTIANIQEYLHLFFLEKYFKSLPLSPHFLTFPEDRKSSRAWKVQGHSWNKLRTWHTWAQGHCLHLLSSSQHFPPKLHPQMLSPGWVCKQSLLEKVASRKCGEFSDKYIESLQTTFYKFSLAVLPQGYPERKPG